MNLFFRMIFSVCNNSFEFLSFRSFNFCIQTYITATVPPSLSFFILVVSSIILFIFVGLATRPSSYFQPISKRKYLLLLFFQLIFGFFKISIESAKQPFISILNAALNINYFFNLLFLSIEVWVVLSQILRAFDRLTACLGFQVLYEILSCNFFLPLTIVNNFFFSVQCFYIVDQVLPFLIKFIHSFSVSLGIFFCPWISSKHR